MGERHVTIPLMVRTEEDIQYVEDDNDTVSENNPSGVTDSNIYSEISCKESKVDYLDIPKSPLSRSTSSDSSEAAGLMLERKSSSRKKINHDYEKLSVTSNTSKKSAVERIAESTFFRRRTDTSYERRGDTKSDDEENVLETLRQVVRKCTNIDPLKRPSSKDVLESMLNQFDKS